MMLVEGLGYQVKERLKFYIKDPFALELLDNLLILDPQRRFDADAALNHDFFWTEPMPCDLSHMLAQHSQNMFEYLAPPRRSTTVRQHSVTSQGPIPNKRSRADHGYRDTVKERLKPYVKDPYACDLLDKLLILDPQKRFDADQALNHDFFWSEPMPTDLSKMLAQHAQSMFEYLTPPRRASKILHHPGADQAPPSKIPRTDTGYRDRVF